MRISYDFFCVWNIIRDKNCHIYFGLFRWIVQRFHQFLYIQLLNISFLSKSCVKSCHSNCSNCLLWLFRREPSKKKFIFKRGNFSKNERFILVIFKKTYTASDSSKRFQNFSCSLFVFFISNPDMLIVLTACYHKRKGTAQRNLISKRHS